MSSQSFFLAVNKPTGISSHQCLARLKKRFGFAKIGHHGTLDPFAGGLLLVGVNEATKFFPYVRDDEKTYVATIRFGSATDTLDHTGVVIAEKPVPPLTQNDLEHAMERLTGTIQQTPPMYSAIKQDGRPLYELAREGKTVERKAREITVTRWRILAWRSPDLEVEITVSRGTYIRVLAEQLAELLGTVAHLSALCRTQLSGLTLADAIDPAAEILSDVFKIALPRLLVCDGELSVTAEQQRDLYFGRVASVPNPDLTCAALFHEGTFFGVGLLKMRQLISLRLCQPESAR
jgi:tRNA pseudouridine(55) synthase